MINVPRYRWCCCYLTLLYVILVCRADKYESNEALETEHLAENPPVALEDEKREVLEAGFGEFEHPQPNLLRGDDSEEEEFEPNPFKMMIAVNTEYTMSVGKVAAQVAHAAVGLYSSISANQKWARTLRLWKEHGSKKIVVNGKNTATLKLMAEKAKKLRIRCCVVRDEGLTEVPPNTLTAVAVFGRADIVSKLTGAMPLLK